MTTLVTRIFLATFLFAGISVGVAKSQEAADNISESEIASLKKELSEAVDASSATRMRRAYKSVVRDGGKLLKSFPKASNRYRVLGIVF